MRPYLQLLLLLLLAPLVPAANFTAYSFPEWKERFGITYPNATEDARREQLFNAKLAELANSSCETCGITKFAADTPEQIAARTNLLLPPNIEEMAEKQEQEGERLKLSSSSDASRRIKVGAPGSLDWREQGAVTGAKAQGSCGTCWSFATVAMCESSLILQGKAFNNRIYSINLSEQFLLKCTPGSSCSGGYLENSIDKAIEKGLPYDKKFPYDPYGANNNGICSTTDLIPVSNASRVSKYYTNDDTMISMLTEGPIAIAVSATGWESYSSGVYQCPAVAPINHAVLLVGYTADYWIIKNSWGADWGQDGFIYVTRNTLRNCGIGTAAHMLGSEAAQLLLVVLVGAMAAMMF